MAADLQDRDPHPHLSKRKAWVQLNKLNTIEIPHDPEDPDASPWNRTENDPPTQRGPRQWHGNDVCYLIDGVDTFTQFEAEINKAGAPGDFIYLLGWYFDIDVEFPSGCTVQKLLAEKAKKGVKIRVMIDGQTHEGNLPWPLDNASSRSVDWLNRTLAFPNGPPPLDDEDDDDTWQYLAYRNISPAAGVSDVRFSLVGCHHQKILLVKSGTQLTAFCGGVDINNDRIKKTEAGRPMHDVHCRIRGPAAWDLLQIFRDRWYDYMRAGEYEKTVGDIGIPTASFPPDQGDYVVQIARTFGSILTAPYDFAPKGEHSIWKLVSKAISSAKRFIYIEDQYLINLKVADLIAAQMPQLRHVTILIPPAHLSLGSMLRKRNEFIRKLKDAGGDKVRVFCLEKDGTNCSTYIHAKTWVFDDQFAIIGSANCNVRGYRHDSEVQAGIYDPSRNTQLTYTFAHRLRVALWAHHLGLDPAELADGVASADMWWFAPNRRTINYIDEPGMAESAWHFTTDNVGWEGGVVDP